MYRVVLKGDLQASKQLLFRHKHTTASSTVTVHTTALTDGHDWPAKEPYD